MNLKRYVLFILLTTSFGLSSCKKEIKTIQQTKVSFIKEG